MLKVITSRGNFNLTSVWEIWWWLISLWICVNCRRLIVQKDSVRGNHWYSTFPCQSWIQSRISHNLIMKIIHKNKMLSKYMYSFLNSVLFLNSLPSAGYSCIYMYIYDQYSQLVDQIACMMDMIIYQILISFSDCIHVRLKSVNLWINLQLVEAFVDYPHRERQNLIL